MRENRLKLIAGAAVVALAASVTPVSADIAITEFIIDPFGTDLLQHEWIELFNYGDEAVNLNGWTLKDNATTQFVFPDVTIPSGGFVIAAASKTIFQDRWLNGATDDRVLGDVPFQMNNGSPGDGLYLRDAGGDLVWSLGYNVGSGNTVSQYRATWLTIDDFTVTDYGVPPQDGTALINRNGLDGTGTLGYEDNNFTTDPFAYASAARDSNGDEIEFGSPLLGDYTAVPEPGGLAFLLLGALGLRRARRA